MLQTLKNAWKLPDIRKKILFVLFILLIYRVGTVVPVPFVDATTFNSQFSGTIFDYMNTLSGGALSTATLFALGVSPYITASIVIQLLTVAFPRLGEIAKDGEMGRRKVEAWTRIVTVILAVVTGFGYYTLLKNNGMLVGAANPNNAMYAEGGHGWVLTGFVIVACYCAGAAVVMWLAELINQKGIGNGISLILFANIVSSLPSFIINLVNLIKSAFSHADGESINGKIVALAFILALVLVIALLAMVVFIIFINGSERRIPIQYAKRVVGRKMYGGQNSTLPIKLNMSGVMPIIFASSIVSLPATILTLTGVTTVSGAAKHPHWYSFYKFTATDGWFYPLMLFILIIAFAYFYITISFNPVEVSNNLQKNGGAIPGIRQGRPTAQYIQKILNKVTLMGALFLAIIAILPIATTPLVKLAVAKILGVETTSSIVSYFASSFTFGGTSILIVVGVALETAREIEAQLTMRNYKGFLS